ncbi:MAG: HAD family phosphatase [Candidatus Riflebacteria bacterium]|nr:HAD family phosphatase [Candidatus Riflebacteria bacterium]
MFDLKRIEMVLFDYGNVISRFNWKVFFARLLGNDPSRIEKFSKEYFTPNGIFDLLETGKVEVGVFFQEIEKLAGKKYEGNWLKWAFCDYFIPILETRKFIRDLKQKKIRLGLLSNTNILHTESEISINPIFHLFDQVTLSYEVKFRKPDPEIYQDAIKKFGGDPGGILYLDDVLSYVEAASRIGIQGLHCDNTERIIKKLRIDFGIPE